MIIDFCKAKNELENKKAVIYDFLVDYYKEIDAAGTINIPYFLRARDKYNELIKSIKDVNSYYKKIMNHYNSFS